MNFEHFTIQIIWYTLTYTFQYFVLHACCNEESKCATFTMIKCFSLQHCMNDNGLRDEENWINFWMTWHDISNFTRAHTHSKKQTKWFHGKHLSISLILFWKLFTFQFWYFPFVCDHFIMWLVFSNWHVVWHIRLSSMLCLQLSLSPSLFSMPDTFDILVKIKMD